MPQGFFAEKRISVDRDKPWPPEEDDLLLDRYFGGMSPPRIAAKHNRTPKSINRRIEQIRNNEYGLAEKYQPKKRLSRKGMRMTQSELLFLNYFKKKGLSLKLLAKILQRPVREFGVDREEREKVIDMKKVGVDVDLCMAYRCLYYCHNISIISDTAYDELEKETIEFAAHGGLLRKPGSDRLEDYPPHIRSLAMYLAFKYAQRKKESDESTAARV